MTPYRPTYENKDHLAKEQELAEFVASKWQCDMRKQDKFNQFDYVAMRGGKVTAFVELRCRSNPIDKYPNCFITSSKLAHAHAMHGATGLPILFLVSWVDAIGFADLTKRYSITVGGRTDRGDKADVEAVAEIPIGDFKLL